MQTTIQHQPSSLPLFSKIIFLDRFINLYVQTDRNLVTIFEKESIGKKMDIQTAQRELRTTFLGGFAGQFVSGTLWLISAALSTWLSQKYGMAFLFLGGMFIFPLTKLTLQLMGKSTSLSAENPLNYLATQIAFTVPINFLLVGAATLFRMDWFYPAAMIVVGAHYLPFSFLYGMWQFSILAGLMIGGGVLFGLYFSPGFSVGGWITGILLLIAAVAGLYIVRCEQKAQR